MASERIRGYRAGKVTRMINLHQEDGSLEGRTFQPELVSVIKNTQKGIFLYSAGYIRRIIRLHQNLGSISFQVPHASEYTLPAEDFRQCLRKYDPAEFDRVNKKVDWNQFPGNYVILLALPSKKEMKSYRLEYFALNYWSYIFHAEIHKQCEGLREKNEFNPLVVRDAVQRLGSVAFEEIRDVLRGENLLFHPQNDEEVLLEFLAYYFQTYYFFPKNLQHFFPSLKNSDKLIKDLTDEIGLDLEKALADSRPPQHTPTVAELKERRDKLIFRRLTTNIYDPQFHVNKILNHSRIRLLFEEEEAKEFVRRLQPFVKDLVGKILKDGKITGELDFVTLRDLAIRRELYLTRKELFLLDKIFSDHFSELYSQATLWQKTLLRLRSRKAIEKDSKNQKRREVTEKSIEKFSQIISQYRENSPTLGGRFFRALGRYSFFWLAFGWLFYLYGRYFSLFFTSALKIQDYFCRKKFEKYFVRSFFANRRNKLVWAMMYIRRIQSIFERIYNRYDLEASEDVKEDLNREFQRYVEPVSETMGEDLGLEKHFQAKLEELIRYLVFKMSLGGEGVESELLLDIENAYVDGSLEFREMNLLGWIFSFGKKPLRYKLVHQEKMRRLKHLRQAKKKVNSLKLPKDKLQEYRRVIEAAYKREVEKIRECLLPIIKEAFAHQAFELDLPQEKIAFEKIQDEIFDVIIERGHSYFTDLRDILSRNKLKLEDLKVWQVFTGDNLLRLDREMGRKLKGIHRSAELYMRFLQVLSSIFFGTRLGRLTSKYIFVPVGAALTVLVVGQMLLKHSMEGLNLITRNKILITSVVLGILIHIPKLRKPLWGLVWNSLVFLFKLPLTLNRRLPDIIRNYLAYPLVGGGILLGLFYFFLRDIALPRLSPEMPLYYVYLILYGSFTLLAGLFINSRLGVWLGNIVAEVTSYAVKAIGEGLLMRLFYASVRLSRIFLQKLEHLIYVVNDYLRFIQGEKASTSIFKALMVLVWLPIAYVFRIYVMIFLEPQINPLKFPVVSISYKIFIPFYDEIHHFLEVGAAFVLPHAVAYGFAAFTTFVFTGAFGFLAWELQENWRLYKHNASKEIRPVIVGSHGETIPQFLRPGFHSGTIPHLFGKLRKASAQADMTQLDYSSVRNLEKEMAHIREDLENFIERDYLLSLSFHSAFEGIKFACKEVALTSHTITFWVEVFRENEVLFEYKVRLEEKKGHLLASFWEVDGTLANLTPNQRRTFAFLLASFYKKCHVDVVREELEMVLHRMYPSHSLESEGSDRMYYDVQKNAVVVTFKDPKKAPRSSSALMRMRRRIMSSFWRSSNQERIPLESERVYFQSNKILWKDFDALYKEEKYELGNPYLVFLGEDWEEKTMGEAEPTSRGEKGEGEEEEEEKKKVEKFDKDTVIRALKSMDFPASKELEEGEVGGEESQKDKSGDLDQQKVSEIEGPGEKGEKGEAASEGREEEPQEMANPGSEASNSPGEKSSEESPTEDDKKSGS